VVGFDNERHVYGDQRYPAQLVLQDVLTIHGSQFRNAALIVASPPCQTYSYMAMPWKRGKAMTAAIRDDQTGRKLDALNALFNACFRIQREAIAATAMDCPACGGKGFMIWYVGECHPCERCGGAGYLTRHIPMVVENVKGAQPWVGKAAWHYGSFYLWGDVPVLMPSTLKVQKFKNSGGSWFAKAHNTESGHSQNPVRGEGVKQHGSGPAWFDKALDERRRESGRKAASAQIAKIPFEPARWIAYCYR